METDPNKATLISEEEFIAMWHNDLPVRTILTTIQINALKVAAEICNQYPHLACKEVGQEILSLVKQLEEKK